MSNNKKRKPLRISLEEAKERYDEGDVTILDVVDPSPYEKLSYRIKGAVRIDPRNIADEFDRLPKARTVLTYCT